jgi:hypothetical protein
VEAVAPQRDAEGFEMTKITTVNDPRRQRPIEVRSDRIAEQLVIDGQLWAAVEWSKKRRVFCIEDAAGRCLTHHASIQGQHTDKHEAVALAKAMIRDGRMPTPEDAENAYIANTNRPAPTPEERKRERDRQLQALLVRRK